MKSIRNSLLSILAAIPLIWISSAIYQNKTFDLQLHDTYFVISPYTLAQIFTISLIGVLSLYFVLNRGNGYLNRALTAVHAIVVLTIAIVLGVLFYFLSAYAEVERYSSDFTFINSLASTFIILVILSVVIFIINLLVSLVQRVIKQKAV
ncbi:hypothetical protein [Tunicatimonas pelagia]|uniref:hypothetical protein n=1 Tax=Tunicatimonas pelagia TaxID=931531 RepID=UPI0026668D54|nr:hypothetical protein [Tunicatimonas pelagia]WKN42556.1 hypothetical protein P0M28_26320 [Tunicatimonas pelagia]